MRTLVHACAVGLALAASPAAAQLSNHGIAVETGISAPLGGGGGTAAAVALSASTWLEGDVEGVARVALASARGTDGRAAAPALSGTVGLRLSLGRAPIRPHAFVEAGWASLARDGGRSGALAAGVGAGVEWFAAGDLSLGARAALRVAGGAPALDLSLALSGYF